MDCGLCDRLADRPDEPVEDWRHEFHGLWVWVCPDCQARAQKRDTERAELLRTLGLVTLRAQHSAV